jgi:predicted tellurium resistance membrane protein TerC
MPWRLLGLILVLAILLSFIGFNLNNTCDISFGFKTIPNVPIYLTVFASFMLGLFASLPFIIFGAFRKKQKTEKPAKQQKAPQESPPADTSPYGVD